MLKGTLKEFTSDFICHLQDLAPWLSPLDIKRGSSVLLALTHGLIGMEPSTEPHHLNSSSSEDEVLRQIDAYDWLSDVEFQRGLQSILSSDPAPEQRDHLVCRAKCFYFSRKRGIKLDPASYCRWVDQKNDAQMEPGSQLLDESTSHGDAVQRGSAVSEDASAPYPTTFNQIVELISTGQPVPGVKDIPDTILEGQASKPVAHKRPKPWERGQ